MLNSVLRKSPAVRRAFRAGASVMLGVSLATVAVATASALDISGAGATFPYPVYAKWADTYKKESGTALNYQSIGSGGGIKQIKAAHRDLRRQRQAAQGRRTRAEGRQVWCSGPWSWAASCRL